MHLSELLNTSHLSVLPKEELTMPGSNVHLSVPLKSSGAAYLWWFFLGGLGAHKVYLGRPGWGILYACTLGLLFLGVIYDLFTIPSQVREANEKMMADARTLYGGKIA
jgi:TM2 domain-containing membrane protein YozV